MKITRLKKQTKLVTPFVRVIKKSQLAIVLTLKTMTNNYIMDWENEVSEAILDA